MTDSTSQNRAQIYWWLSSLIAAELDDKQLTTMFSDEMGQFLASLAYEPDLQPSVENLRSAINKLRLREDIQLELAADYAELFLGAGRSSVQPYASVYLSDDGLMVQQPHHDMIANLGKHGFGQSEEYKEPADHLAVILDFMGNLAVKGVDTDEQKRCLDESLLSWVPAWSERVKQHDRFGFYTTVGLLIEAFCRVDRKHLQQCEQ